MKKFFVLIALISLSFTGCTTEETVFEDSTLELMEQRKELIQEYRQSNPLSDKDAYNIQLTKQQIGDSPSDLTTARTLGEVVCVSEYGTHWVIYMGNGIYSNFYSVGDEIYVFHYTWFEMAISGGFDCTY